MNWLRRLLGLSTENREALEDVRNSLRFISENFVTQVQDEQVRAIITTNLFIVVQKVRYVLGESDRQ